MMMSFIDRKLTSGVKIVLKDGIFDARGEELYGITMLDEDIEDHYSIYISKNSNQVAALIHEFLHKMFPDQEEDFIKKLEAELMVSFTTDQIKTFEKYLK